jgi:hypothetical protein
MNRGMQETRRVIEDSKDKKYWPFILLRNHLLVLRCLKNGSKYSGWSLFSNQKFSEPSAGNVRLSGFSNMEGGLGHLSNSFIVLYKHYNFTRINPPICSPTAKCLWETLKMCSRLWLQLSGSWWNVNEQLIKESNNAESGHPSCTMEHAAAGTPLSNMCIFASGQ